MLTFEDIIAPKSLSQFFSEFEGQEYFHISREESLFYNPLITIAQVDQHLAGNKLIYPDVMLAKQGVYVPRSKMVTEPGGNIVDNKKMWSYFNDGYTILLNNIHSAEAGIGSFCSLLESQLKIPVTAYIFITPPNNVGFSPHGDPNDIFILHLQGKKNWKLYDMPEQWPLKGVTHQPENAPSFENTLYPGDLLYLPRGLVHEAASGNEVTIHLAIRLQHHKGADLLTEFIKSAGIRDFFRKSVPNAAADKTALNAYLDQFKVELSKLVAETNALTLYDNRLKSWQENHSTSNVGRLNDSIGSATLQKDSILKKREDVLINIKSEKKQFIIEYGKNVLSFPLPIRPIAEQVLNGEPFTPASLEEEIDWELLQAFLRQLIQHGLIKFDSK